jgi:hypothetical protein
MELRFMSELNKNNAGITQFLKECYTEAAQAIYDTWHQDEDGLDVEVGTGGICSRIAEEAIDYIQQAGYDAWLTGSDEHAWVAVEANGKVLEVDIPHQHYELGGGYNWTKIPGVTFTEDHVIVWESTEADPALEACRLM